MIEHCGVVERTERDTVYVRITSRSACGTCKARQACGLAEAQDKIVAVVTPEAGQYAAGRVPAYAPSCWPMSVRWPSCWPFWSGRSPSPDGAKVRAPSPLLRAWAFIILRCGSSGGKSNTQFNLQ